MEAERMHKVRCYNCGKVFDQGKVKILQRLLHINKVLTNIDREKLESGTYNKETLRIFTKQIETEFNKIKGTEASEYQLIVNLRNLLSSPTSDQLLSFYDRYHFKPFNIGKPDDFNNTYEKLMEEEIGLKRACCKTHFQTPYLLSRGLTNLVTVEGYESQWTKQIRMKKEVEVKDPLNLPNTMDGKEEEGEEMELKPVTREDKEDKKERVNRVIKDKILIKPEDFNGIPIEKDDLDVLKENDLNQRKIKETQEMQKDIFDRLEQMPIPTVDEVVYPDEEEGEGEKEVRKLQPVNLPEVTRRRGGVRGRPKGTKKE